VPMLLVLFFGSVRSNAALALVLGTLAVVLIIAVISMRFGCYLDLATAVGNVPVRSVAFEWTARRFAATLAPVVSAAQQPPVEELPASV